jgi:hypothetical protein
MNFWQFKFDMKNGTWKEFETISRGEKFSQSIKAYKKMENTIGDIVFYYRMDKPKGIYFLAEIASNPYQEENNTGYAIDLIIIKKLNEPFDDKENIIYKTLQNKLDPMGQGASKYLFKPEDNGLELYEFLMENTDKLNEKIGEIDPNDYKEISKIKQTHIDNGYLFNAFHNLNLIRNEVKHLAFIGNLLNPYGNHFKNDLFLKLFLQSLLEYDDLCENDVLQNFVNDNPFVEIEKVIKDEDGDYFGRIDLWLESEKYIIAIEGKIEAKDNKGQLKKYDKYLQRQNKKYLLIYLTLKKDEKPENIHQEELQNFHLMNFEQDIFDFIEYSIDHDEISENIKNILLDYKDALLKYMFGFHLSFEYAHNLIKEITKDKKSFEKYQQMKEYYYQNKKICRNTIIEDIAENFEYAKAYIERSFFVELKQHISENFENYIFNDHYSNIQLGNNPISIAKDIFTIDQARSKRLRPITQHEHTNFGKINIMFNYEEESDEIIELINNSFGLLFNNLTYIDDEKLINPNIQLIQELRKLKPDIFKSDNISKLLDKKYVEKQIQTIFFK